MAVGSVLFLQHFAGFCLAGEPELVLSQPFVPAATRWGPQATVLYRGQAEGARAGRGRAQPHCFGDTGASSEGVQGCSPSACVPC